MDHPVETFQINQEKNVYEIGSNKILYYEEISQMKKKIIFYGPVALNQKKAKKNLFLIQIFYCNLYVIKL